MKKRIGIQGSLMFFALFMSVVFARVLFPSWQNRVYDSALDYLGFAIVLTGFLFRISARGYKWERSGNGKNLITDGPYSLLRHPMYFGTLLIGIGVILVLFAWWTFPIFLAVFLLIYIPQIRKEEALLSERFKSQYESYFAETPRYFPKLSALCRPGVRGRLFFKLPWVKKELPSLIGVFAAVIGLEAWGHFVSYSRPFYAGELMPTALVLLLYLTVLGVFFRK